MTRVLVVGSDSREEQALLQRLRHAASLPVDAVMTCTDLDTCDLLVVRDTPGLRNAARRMVSTRPDLQLWMQDDRGQLHDGLADTAALLDNDAIERALNRSSPRIGVPDAPFLASGSKQVTRILRRRLQEKAGYALLSLQGQPQLLIDFEHDQAVPMYVHPGEGPTLAQQLGDLFELLALQDLGRERYLQLADTLSRQPLRPVLWQMAQHGDHWTDLDRRLRQHAQVRLLRWPDFRVLAHQHDGFRLCSLLLKKPCTLEECSRLLGIEVDPVRAFMRSTYLCGYAAIEVPTETYSREPVSAKAGAGTLLARMWRSVRAKAGA